MKSILLFVDDSKQNVERGMIRNLQLRLKRQEAILVSSPYDENRWEFSDSPLKRTVSLNVSREFVLHGVFYRAIS